MSLKRIETKKGHRYTLDGKPVQGVTTLLGGGLPKPALTYWAAKMVAEWVADNEAGVESLRSMGRNSMVAALKQTPWTARDEAAVRGTDVHALAEELVKGHEVEVPEHLAGYVDSYVRFLDDFQPEPVLVEAPVASRQWWYAGTLDLVADIGPDRWLLDVKTARGVYGDNALQVDAYRNAEFHLDADGAEQPMPEGITRLGIIHVRADDYDLVPLDSSGAAFKDFLHVAYVSRAADRIKSYVGKPIEPPTESTGSTAA